ncbi:MAG TPA: hypothetical protein EYP10_13590, partial [Armatimonadetes bacterium]|nr:hypothetical protein [Armatimonadota bacterium]
MDVGVEGDDSIFVRGCSHREDWGKLPPGKFGADTRLTVRWTPATGNVTVLSLPASPYRKHIWRIGATAIWSNEVSVRIGDRIVGGFKIEPGYQVYEIKISPDAIGSATAIEVRLVYKQAHVPGRIDPKRYGTESRVCNLAIDWIQFSTSNIPVGERRRMGIREANRVRLTDAIFTPYQGTVLNVPVSHRRAVAPQLAHGRIIAQYDDGIPRDIICEPDERLLVVNGLFCDSDAWWEAILRNWAGVNVPRYVRGEHIMSARLQAGDTQIILVENRDITEPAQITCHIPQRDTPLANITILSRDGAYIEPLNGYVDDGGNRAFRDKVMYYGVYELAFSPVRCEVPKMIIHPGETTLVQLRLQNLTDRQVRGEVAIESIVPSLRSQPVQVELKPHQALKAKVPLTARTDVDWGHKTVAIRLTFDDKTAYLFRRLTVETNARVTVRERAITSLEPYITVVNQPNRFIGAETAYDVRIHLQTSSRTRSSSARRNRIIKIGDIPSGQERRIKLPIGRMPVRQLQRTKLIKVKIAYRDSAGEHEVAVPLTVAFINRQATLSRANGAMAYIVITNGNDEPIDHAPIEVKLPLEVAGKITRTSKVVVYEPGGNPLPTQFDRTTRMLTFPALVPPHDTIVFTVRESNVASSHEIIATPLHTNARALGTGHGKVTIETNAFKVTLDESHGATVTQLISKVTGRDYGAGAFGVAYGTFSRYDPIKPAIDTTKFVVDDMVRQADGTGKLELVTIGPMRTVVRARYEDDAVRAIQTYTFYANSNAFRIDVHVEPKRLVGAQELVALDARFQPHLLYKSFPNFVGIRTDATDKVHYGWRMGAWVPPYFTLMNPPAFDESISLILRQASGVDAVRQGFWGEQRGKPGARKYAWIEIISTRKSTSKLTCWVLLHRGHQVIADKFSKSLERSPLVTVMPTAVRIAEGVQPRTLPRDWHLAYWHYRTYVKLSVPQPLRYSQPFALHIERIPSVAKFARAIDPNSFRVVRIRDGALIPCFYNADSKMLTWIINPNDGLHPEYFIYYDTKANVPKPKVTGGIEQLVVREKFDEPSVPPGWKFLHAELAKGEGVNGSNAVRLRIKGSDELALIHCYAIWVAPNVRYSVRFKARVAYSADGKPFVRTNFFANRRYDFTQIQVDLKPDGKWHQYEVEVPTGAFPKDVRPFFRIWILSKPQEILIDDVEDSYFQ